MDKRYTAMTPHEQLERRRAVIETVRAEPGRPISEVLVLLRGGLRLTLSEYSHLTGVSARVIQDVERGSGNPTLATLDKLLRPFGLRLGVFSAKPGQVPNTGNEGEHR